jgi:DNA methyltransferase 1-associated protein 1
MSDVANILGVQGKAPVGTAGEEAAKILSAKPVPVKSNKQPKPKGMSREVYSLMGQDSIAPIAPANAKLTGGMKSKRASLVHGKWVWAAFTNSARTDGEQFHHWVKASIEYPDYPYAKFDAKIEAVTYSSEEYDVLLLSSRWNRSETDHLLDLCFRFDLRWPVIVDRYSLLPPRTLDEIRSRYYFIVSRLKRSRTGIPDEVVRSENFVSLDVDYEKQRRANLELLFRRTKESAAEESRLKEELKGIDQSLKKLKRGMPTAAQSDTGGNTHVKRESSSSSSSSSSLVAETKSGRGSGGSGSAAATSAAAAATAALYAYDPKLPPKPHAPIAGRPHLQSSRLGHAYDPATLNLSRSRLQKMDLLLTELGLPENVTPTRVVCDLFDEVSVFLPFFLSFFLPSFLPCIVLYCLVLPCCIACH